MSRHRYEILIGLGVLAISISYVAWSRSRNTDPRGPGPQRDMAVPATPSDESWLSLATDDDIPGLSLMRNAGDSPTNELAEMVGRDPRMFDRGPSPERIVLLENLSSDLEFVAQQDAGGNIETRREIAFAKYDLALMTAEMEHGTTAGHWGAEAAQELEALYNEDTQHWPTRLRLARINRLLGEIELGRENHDVAFARQLFASDLIRGAVEQSPEDAGLQLEWGIQLTYLAEAQLKFGKPQLALQSFQGANDCFERYAAFASDVPHEPVSQAVLRSQDVNRRYFEAYNNYALAMLLTRANQPLDAREHWSQSLDTFQALAEEFPDTLKFRQRYAQAVSNEGSRLATANDAGGALPLFEQAAELYAALVSDAPWDATNQHGLAMAVGNQAMLLATEERYEEALAAALQSLDVWDTYVEMRPEGNFSFRDAVVWKAAELLAQQATEKLADEPAAALSLAQQQVELVTAHWERNELLRQSTTLHALEMGLAEEGCQQVVEFRDEADDWLLVLEGLIARLQARRPEDADVLALKEQLESLRMMPQ